MNPSFEAAKKLPREMVVECHSALRLDESMSGAGMDVAATSESAKPDSLTAELTVIEVPVVFEKGFEVLWSAVQEVKPDLVFAIGQAGGRDKLTPEMVAINWADARIPDNDGNQPLEVPVIEGAPKAYFTRMPAKRMAAAASEAGVPAAVSYSAGTYVCNDLFFRLLHEIDEGKAAFTPQTGIFIHVPFVKEQNREPSMELSGITRGLEIMIREAIRLSS